MINGLLYDWESVEIMLPSGITVGVTNIDYDDERPVEERYGRGSVSRGFGRKNYKASAKMEMDLDEAVRLTDALGGSVYLAEPFQVIVSYGSDGMETITDVLPSCQIVKSSAGAKQGDDNVGVRKYDLKVLEPIQWGGIPAM